MRPSFRVSPLPTPSCGAFFFFLGEELFLMDDNEREHVRSLLRSKLAVEELNLFRNTDLDLLASNGFTLASVFAAADENTLEKVLPGRLGLVRLLLRTFVQSQPPAGGANRINLSERTKCDFKFKAMENWTPGTVLDTAEIAVAMKDFGGFPDKYFVRLEETIVFTKCLEYFSGQKRLRAVIVGSPGVGKSVFLVLLAFYLALVCSRSVIILRKLKEDHRFTRACVHVSRKGYCGALFQKWDDFLGIVDQLEESSFFVDGFTQEDINRDNGSLGGFKLLATSSQYQLKSDDVHTRLILLPAWRPEDLRDFADHMGTFPSNFKENFEKAYSYSGGSLREFLNSNRSIVYSMSLRRVEEAGVRNLLAKYGAGSTSQVDTIRKLFVKNRSDPEHYVDVLEWVSVVDSSMAVRDLHERLSEEDLLTILNVAEGIRGAFHGNAFEWYIHKRASSDGGLSFEAWHYGSKIPIGEFDVPGGAAVRKGERVADCHRYLQVWPAEDTKYWYPDMLNSPTLIPLRSVIK